MRTHMRKQVIFFYHHRQSGGGYRPLMQCTNGFSISFVDEVQGLHQNMQTLIKEKVN